MGSVWREGVWAEAVERARTRVRTRVRRGSAAREGRGLTFRSDRCKQEFLSGSDGKRPTQIDYTYVLRARVLRGRRE
jgi:hypothetical protein